MTRRVIFAVIMVVACVTAFYMWYNKPHRVAKRLTDALVASMNYDASTDKEDITDLNKELRSALANRVHISLPKGWGRIGEVEKIIISREHSNLLKKAISKSEVVLEDYRVTSETDEQITVEVSLRVSLESNFKTIEDAIINGEFIYAASGNWRLTRLKLRRE